MCKDGDKTVFQVTVQIMEMLWAAGLHCLRQAEYNPQDLSLPVAQILRIYSHWSQWQNTRPKFSNLAPN